MEPDISTSATNGHGHASSEDRLPLFLHDLNNLLGIVLGNAELLQEGRDSEEKSGRRIIAIHTAAAKARDLAAALQCQLNEPR